MTASKLTIVLVAFAPAVVFGQNIDLSKSRIVDLSHAFTARTLYWPNSPTSFALEKLFFGVTPGGFFYAANQFAAPEHGGTHLDAPIHFAEGKQFNHEIPLERLEIGRASCRERV